MKVEIKLQEDDYVNFYVYKASNSERIAKKMKNGQRLLTILLALSSLFFYYKSNLTLSIYFGITAVLVVLFFPKYFKWRYITSYKTQIKDLFADRLGKPETIEFTEDHLIANDYKAVNKYKYGDIFDVSETAHYFYIKIDSVVYLIIPKLQIDDIGGLKSQFTKVGLTINQAKDTAW